MFDEKTIIEASQFFIQSDKGVKLIARIQGLKSDTETLKVLAKDAKKYIPTIKAYTVSGQIYDKQTNEPLQGVKVTPQFALYPVKSVVKDVKVVAQEVVFDEDPDSDTFGEILKKRNGEVKTKRVVTNKKVTKWEKADGEKFVKTDKQGNFTVKVGLPVLEDLGDAVLIEPKLLYEKENFAPSIQNILNGTNEVLKNLPLQGLLNIDKAAEIEAEKIKFEINNVIDKISNLTLNPVDNLLVTLRNFVLKFARTIQEKLFPLALGLFIVFGIAKLAQAGNAKCPPNALLRAAIKRRNSIVKQLNQIWIVVLANTVLAGLFLYLSGLFKSGKITIGQIPVPVAVPPGIGLPYSIISGLKEIEILFDKLSDINKELKKALIIALVFLIASLILIIIYLRKIDEILQKCVIASQEAGGDGDGDGDDGLTMVDINSELLALSENDANNQGDPIVTNVNGFKMDVVVDQDSKVGDTYRRYATATNSQGVVILKGEPSFSAEDQILIDELAFYIVNNNLKAD